MIIETSFKQHDPEWHAARVGSIGATGVKSIVTSTGKDSGSRDNQLIITAEEILTGVKRPFYPTYDMKVGTEREPEANKTFSMITGWETEECAMIYPDERKRWHISPDFIMPDREEGGEIKCRSLKVFMEHYEKGVLPTSDRLQVQQSLAVTGWKTWWYFSYFPGLKPLMIPVGRDEKLIEKLKDGMERFIIDLDELIVRLKK